MSNDTFTENHILILPVNILTKKRILCMIYLMLKSSSASRSDGYKTEPAIRHFKKPNAF